ncbi:hypothetical protein [Pectobacterium punjabense]|nr:hypothetical protein [Pectobacterium punjabense]MBN3137561.1 hypothetical protein [Pectobacterium punjabense]MCE5380575.1 hypothetical protein [Pectobacterium punjabense]
MINRYNAMSVTFLAVAEDIDVGGISGLRVSGQRACAMIVLRGTLRA